jgi:protein-S-isoprenylcysteine O-methyltransferase Ste14
MLDIIALLILMLWPIIPLWWIPVHGANKLVKNIGFLMYPIMFVLWIFIAYPIYVNSAFLLGYRIDFSIVIRAAGIFCACVGSLLQLWTVKVLTARTITGVPEVFNGVKTALTVHGPFSRVRHPTYLSHTLFFLGIFLSSGILAVGLVALIDFLIVSLIIIPLEENELQQRFGDEYRSYMTRVPRFIPRLSKQAKTEAGDKLTDTGNSSKLA